jgi:hypothetical protein
MLSLPGLGWWWKCSITINIDMKPTVPFTIQNVFQGFAETEGILSVDDTDLKLEFVTADSLLGLLKSDVHEVRLPLNGIEEIAFRKGLFGCSLVIRVAEMRRASDVPNFKRGEILLSIAKKHRSAAAELVASVQLAAPSH